VSSKKDERLKSASDAAQAPAPSGASSFINQANPGPNCGEWRRPNRFRVITGFVSSPSASTLFARRPKSSAART